MENVLDIAGKYWT